ncbi:MAG: hypothetical protein ACI9G1_004640 [Pirellulaceae bacterium]|jgi:hypothetical protein
MHHVGQAFRRANVLCVYLIHGTFVGNDAVGLIRKVARFFPDAAQKLKSYQKQVLEAIVDDCGNFTESHRSDFENAIAESPESPIPVRLFNWSSENLHIGRADGAVRLIDTLHQNHGSQRGRVLLIGHSHGANVVALLTNLLGADAAHRRQFFDACKPYYQWPMLDVPDLPVWERVDEFLQDSTPNPLTNLKIDCVTLGAPIRYGWDTLHAANLLHFIYHRPQQSRPEHLTGLPNSLEDLLEARTGDYVQHAAVAGTDFSPSLFAWRARLAENNLKRLLQPGLRRRDLLQRLNIGARAHQDGLNLLVDYGSPGESFAEHFAGHAIYTQQKWLGYHAKTIAREFYGQQAIASD